MKNLLNKITFENIYIACFVLCVCVVVHGFASGIIAI